MEIMFEVGSAWDERSGLDRDGGCHNADKGSGKN